MGFEEILQPLYDSLESGILLVGHDGLVTSCSLAMAMLFGRSPAEVLGLTTADVNKLVLSLLDEPAQRLREEGLFPQSTGVRCEEFELLEPSRTVVRWVARKVKCPHGHRKPPRHRARHPPRASAPAPLPDAGLVCAFRHRSLQDHQ